ncbi:MAG TPA: sortase [Candidatus Saccharimonadia bacterium]|nr:sortase [Candidatus Saccharimonadia bacterium]
MQNEHSLVEKVRYISSVSVVYALTLLFAWAVIHPAPSPKADKLLLAGAAQNVPRPSSVHTISGQPIRIVIPASNVDLPVDPGYYDTSQQTWTLSGYHAQYAMISQLANNVSGDTFIYGHNNNYVFGALRHVTPAVGAQALLYTDNGHVFVYAFDKAFNISPDDTTVLNYNGPPIMTIQTCTGSLNEWRTMYRFHFVRVQQ